MHFKPERFYHLHNRTFNNTLAFPKRANYAFFVAKLAELAERCDIICYCLMPDQFHLIVHLPEGALALARTPDDQMQKFCKWFGKTLSSYTRAYNKQQHRRGSLFQPRTRSVLLTGDLQACFESIHNKPVTAGLVFEPGEWEFSSFQEYYGQKAGLCHVGLVAF